MNGRSYAGGSDTEILNEPFTVAQKGTSQGEISGDGIEGSQCDNRAIAEGKGGWIFEFESKGTTAADTLSPKGERAFGAAGAADGSAGGT